jgi:hypothetical protein
VCESLDAKAPRSMPMRKADPADRSRSLACMQLVHRDPLATPLALASPEALRPAVADSLPFQYVRPCAKCRRTPCCLSAIPVRARPRPVSNA